MSIQSVVVFCGSREGAKPIYAQHAKAVGELLLRTGKTLVYGGGRNGLMGIVADAVMAGGGTVRGVIPQTLATREVQHDGLSELKVVEDMHTRKRHLYEWADAAIILPGGMGTLDELFEIITWNVLSIHDKRIFILNSGGFYDHLLAHLKRLEEEGFVYGPVAEMMEVVNEPEEIEIAL